MGERLIRWMQTGRGCTPERELSISFILYRIILSVESRIFKQADSIIGILYYLMQDMQYLLGLIKNMSPDRVWDMNIS